MTHFVKSPLNFLMESLGSFTCDVINEEGATKDISPVPGTVEGGVNAGPVGSVGGGKVGGSPMFSLIMSACLTSWSNSSSATIWISSSSNFDNMSNFPESNDFCCLSPGTLRASPCRFKAFINLTNNSSHGPPMGRSNLPFSIESSIFWHVHVVLCDRSNTSSETSQFHSQSSSKDHVRDLALDLYGVRFTQ